jgi:hypothetical protein
MLAAAISYFCRDPRQTSRETQRRGDPPHALCSLPDTFNTREKQASSFPLEAHGKAPLAMVPTPG